ncbi:hypothetical protein JOB18_044484 [Solea senegalensis]|uniref:CFA20 domain-containing protein n=2 Tax=Solea senegalensis TaxID=28829 RepID=A0AAV6QS90_SOLSE|nr:uncharacterized protein C3orf67 homolog isoform X1 [Solea senegalensis]KAG7495103.1 hypothetical protein JOB18_044484 [Solea senegalensis]
MFSRNYQGGAVVEIFSAQGKDPVAKWKLSGGQSAIHKEYNKEVKGFVYRLEGSSQTVKMQMPENMKMSLGLLQRFLVLQVNIPQGKDFSLELVITDSEHLKRRLHLSTVHKELTATLLHARVPFVGLKRDIWSTLCIDLVSFTAELFKGFLSLDGIAVFATCKVRRIFTMKTVPPWMADDVACLSGPVLMDEIPRSCQFPSGVNHVTQMLNMMNLRKTVLRSSDCVPDPSGTVRSTSNQQTRLQGVLHTASGSKASAAPPQTGRKSSVASGRMNRSETQISNTESLISGTNQKDFTDAESIGNASENASHGQQKGTPGKLQPHPPIGKQGSKKMRVLNASTLSAHSDAVPGRYGNGGKNREKCLLSSSGQESRQQPLTLTNMADECSISPTEDSAPTPAESLPCPTPPVLSSDLHVWKSWESNDGSEPQLTLHEEVFVFSSQPHSPKRGQGHGDQEKMEMRDGQAQIGSGQRYEAQPEDDFMGSESDEEKNCVTLQQQSSEANPTPPPSPPDRALNGKVDVQPESHNIDTASPEDLFSAITTGHIESPLSGRSESAMVPTRCLSPSVTSSRQEHKCIPCGSEGVNQIEDAKSRVTLSRSLLHEVKLDVSPQHQEEDEALKTVDSSHYDLHLLGSLRMHGDDDEELRMLASLKREQEEDECRASGLSASQIHQCNVSVSMSSDDTSTWTHVAKPSNQGHHYQNEMNPLLHSNPREWMDVLSPPIMPPNQPRRSGSTPNNWGNLVEGGEESVNGDELEDEYLNLLYDPCLNCYFDPKTGKYYELA